MVIPTPKPASKLSLYLEAFFVNKMARFWMIGIICNMSDNIDNCIKCSTLVRVRQEGLQCEVCTRWQHRKCNNGISREQYRNAVKHSLSLEWTCDHCQAPAEDDPEPSIIVERSFNIPEPVLEESIQEESIDDVPIDFNPTNAYHFVDAGSNRGKRKLVDTEGFSYTVKKQKVDHILWRCTKRAKNNNCPATVIQDGDTYRTGLKQHIHPAEPGIHIAVTIKAQVKSQAKECVFGKPSSAIVKSAMREHANTEAPAASRPNPDYLVRTCNRIRQSERPQDPVDLLSELNTDFIDHHAPGFFRKDITVGDNRHLIFFTDRQSQLLATAKTWYMDGTFRVVNAPWQQLFSIHSFVKSGSNMKQIRLVFCVMSGKRKQDYYEVLRVVDRMLPEQIALKGFVADFEAGLWQALKKRFPGYPIQGCVFHWSKAVFRKIQDEGLQTAYNQKDTVYRFLRQAMALPFLPPEHVEDVFHQLDQRAPDNIKPVMDYIYNTWINNSVYQIQFWTVFMTSIRTNNDVEGWHNHLNTNLTTRGPVPFYLLVTELYAEATDIPLQLKMVTEGKMQRHQRRRMRQIQGKVFHLWDQYVTGTLSASHLLRECAAIYGPPAE